jgi:integrase
LIQNPDLQVDQLRPYHVQLWLDGMMHLSSGSRRNHCRAIKRTMRWAQQQGYIDHNRIALMEQPKAGKRETVLTQEEFDRILELVTNPGLRDLIVATWETGCRPQESLQVEARHVDLANSRWVFRQTEGKGEQTVRIVYLTETVLHITRRLMLQ